MSKKLWKKTHPNALDDIPQSFLDLFLDCSRKQDHAPVFVRPINEEQCYLLQVNAPQHSPRFALSITERDGDKYCLTSVVNAEEVFSADTFSSLEDFCKSEFIPNYKPILNDCYDLTKEVISYEDNQKVLSLLSQKCFVLLNNLGDQFYDLSLTTRTVTEIKSLLACKHNDVLGCLNGICAIVNHLATPRSERELLDENQYPYQGKLGLYDILDEIRHEYRMSSFDIEDLGLNIAPSTNNIVLVGKS